MERTGELEYGEMPEARVQANQFYEGIKAFGFSPEQIQRYSDSDKDTVKEAIDAARRKIKTNASQGRRTLLLCFYVGHGAET